MPRLYFDTSALVKKHVPESGSSIVAELFAGRRNSEVFLTSYISLIELVAFLSRARTARTLSQSAELTVRSAMLRDLDTMRVRAITWDIQQEARRFAERFGLKAADCCQLATANLLRLEFPGESMWLVSADLRMLAAAEQVGLSILNPLSTDAPKTLRAFRKN
ncbi:MAG: type II toxin-antitoxin system VapC family toxin [Chloroflexi bacterium]|nr:type II toxin-antitoxin system VapC family toxin [Chloroflexota bacterium]